MQDARRPAAEAGVEIDWVEADAGELPFDIVAVFERFNTATDRTLNAPAEYLLMVATR